MDSPSEDASGSLLSEAILRSLLYADIFFYPLTIDEIHRHLVRVVATRDEVEQALAEDAWLRAKIVVRPPYVALAHREEAFLRRQAREEANHTLWEIARRYASFLAGLPFVRMVAVTGSLAVNNAPNSADDIDFMLVTTPNRVWLARLFAVILARVGHLERVLLCPNYVVDLDALHQIDHSLFTAHELAQMVPLYGYDVYQKLIAANAWAMAWLPNAFQSSRSQFIPQPPRSRLWLKRALERLLDGKMGDMLERWEMTRKIRRLTAEAERKGSRAVQFGPKQCKGHMRDFGAYVAAEYAARLEQYHLSPDDV